MNENGIVDEVETDPRRQFAFVKMNRDRLTHLVLKVPQILALRSNSAGFTRGVPGGDQPARLFVAHYLESDFIHYL